MAKVNVEVKRNGTENAQALIRRFQKKVQESGILPKVRSVRYAEREMSALKTKNAKLRKIANTVKYERLKRLGKLVERKKRR
jgi:ribosomal protein S21